MTPKEKAIELVDKFYDTTPNEAWYNPPLASASMEYKAWVQAKQCALIAVDEIIKCNPTNPEKWDYVENYTIMVDVEINYWEEVKQEIEKL